MVPLDLLSSAHMVAVAQVEAKRRIQEPPEIVHGADKDMTVILPPVPGLAEHKDHVTEEAEEEESPLVLSNECKKDDRHYEFKDPVVTQRRPQSSGSDQLEIASTSIHTAPAASGPEETSNREGKEGRVRRRFTPHAQQSTPRPQFQDEDPLLQLMPASRILTEELMTEARDLEQFPHRQPLQELGQGTVHPSSPKSHRLMQSASKAGGFLQPLPLQKSAILNANESPNKPHFHQLVQQTQASSRKGQSRTSNIAPHPIVHRSKTIALRHDLHSRGHQRVTKSTKRPVSSIRSYDSCAESNDYDHLAGQASPPSDADLLQFLEIRVQHDKKMRDNIRATLQKKEAEVQHSKKAVAAMSSQLKVLQDREKYYVAEKTRYQTLGQELKTKAGKFHAFLQGLTRDHNRLREDAKLIQRDRQGLEASKREIEANLQGARQVCGTVELQGSNMRQTMSEARREIEKLVETVRIQGEQAQSDADTIGFERGRTERLQNDMSKIVETQNRLLELSSENRHLIVDKLDDFLAKSRLTLTEVTSDGKERIQTMLDRCDDLFGQFKSTGVIGPKDLQRFDASIVGYAERYVETYQLQRLSIDNSQHHRST